MFFVAPLWICVLIPILLAPFPLGVSLVIRQRRAPAFEAAYLAIAGFAISFVLGGVLLAAALVAFILVTHHAAQSIGASVVDANPSPPFPSRAQVTTTVAIVAQIGLIAAVAHDALADGPVSHIAGTLVPFGVSYFAFHGISYVMDVHRRRVAAEHSILRLSWAEEFQTERPAREPPDDPGNATINFHGERRSNQTHQSTTDPDSRLFKKAKGHEATLAYLGEVLMENRHGLVVDACVVPATGGGERDAATSLVASLPRRRVTIGGDKAYDTYGFVGTLRTLEATPHIALKRKSRTLDARTTRHPGYAISETKKPPRK